MSLHPEDPTAPPEETRRVARAAFPKGTLCLDIADALGPIYQDSQFAGLFPQLGQPAAAPGALALATVLQFLEGLSDRQAADAVRGRIDWKYALGLALTDPGFDHTVLSEFRSRLVEGKAEQLLLDTLLDRLRDLGLVKPRGRQRTDSTHVLAAVRGLNRLERVGETLRAALNELAVDGAGLAAGPGAGRVVRALRPGGSRTTACRRPTRRARSWRPPSAPTGMHAAAGDRRRRPASPGWRRSRRCRSCGRSGPSSMSSGTGRCAGVTVKDMPAPADHDLLALRPGRALQHQAGKYLGRLQGPSHRDLRRRRPPLIINVETTPATTPDDNMLAVIHKSLESAGPAAGRASGRQGLHRTRGCWSTAEHDYGVTIVGPVADDPSWQARAEEGLDKAQFLVDWERQVVTCPAGKQSISWLPNTYPQNGMVFEARFARRDCTPCPLRSRCTRAKREPRIIGLQAREHYEALQAARKRQATAEFRRAMPPGPASRPRTGRPSAAAACGAAATSGSPKRTCSTSSPLPPSTWSGSQTG